MKTMIAFILCILCFKASSQVPIDSIVLDDVFIVDCACRVNNIIVVDLNSLTLKDKAYRLYFKESTEGRKISSLRRKNTIKVNTVVYLYQPDFVGHLSGRMVQFPETPDVVIRNTTGKQKRRILLRLEYDLLAEFKVKRRCSKRVAHVF